MEIGNRWYHWKGFLGRIVLLARSLGLKQKTVEDLAYYPGEVFAKYMDPANREQRLMRELWEVADEKEQRVLGALMARLSEKTASRPTE